MLVPGGGTFGVVVVVGPSVGETVDAGVVGWTASGGTVLVGVDAAGEDAAGEVVCTYCK